MLNNIDDLVFSFFRIFPIVALFVLCLLAVICLITYMVDKISEKIFLKAIKNLELADLLNEELRKLNEILEER